MPVSDKKLAVAQRIATSHLIDDAVQEVFLLESEDEDATTPIKLLEVVRGTVERGIEPVFFRPDTARGVDFSLVIIELSPREWETYGDQRPLEFRGEPLFVTRKLASR